MMRRAGIVRRSSMKCIVAKGGTKVLWVTGGFLVIFELVLVI